MGVRDNQLRLALLGKPQFEYNEQPLLGLTSVKGQALLAYLAVTHQPHSRSALANLLWSEMPEADARANLRVALSQLRKIVDDHLIVTRRSIEFNRNSNYWLDVEVLENAAQGRIDPAPAADLYRGDFLEDFYVPEGLAFEEWLRVEREHLRQLVLEVLGKLAGTALEQGQFADGINAARRLLSLEPWLETGHQQLMKLLAASGQRSAALAQYETCRRLLAEELGVEPAPETRTLCEQIRQGTLEPERNAALNPMPAGPAIQTQPLRHNLPYPATSFVGRQKELEKILHCLSIPDCRLLSLVGPGGIGKTRLALQTAKTLVNHHHFADGVYIVLLAGIPSIEALVPAIANAVGFSFFGSQEPYRQLLSYLQPKKLLLLLDNFEHLVNEASLLAGMLQAAPDLKFLVTSRARLNLYEEWQVELQGLEAPPANTHLEQLKSYSAVQLFIERARQANLDFPSETDLPVVGRICQMLGGMPLAIELAAGWTQSHSSWEILGQIQQGLDILATPLQNVPDRHRSLRVAFDHSWRLLLAEDQQTFARLAVFQGGFEAEAAKYVTNASVATLARLSDSSMLDHRSERYYIHELLRQFGLEKLMKATQCQARWRHCAFYGSFLQRRESLRQTGQELVALAEIEVELDNIRAGWLWLIERLADPDEAETIVDCLQQYAPMLAYFYEHRSRFQEGVRVFQQAAAAMEAAGWSESAPSDPVGPQKQLILALIWGSKIGFYFNLSQFLEVEQLIVRSLPVLRQAERWQEIATALAWLGRTYDRLGKFDQARGCLQESLALFRELGDHIGLTATLNGLGVLAISEGRYDDARRFLEECLTIFSETGYQRGMAITLNNLGTGYLRQDQPEQAMPFYEKAFEAAKAANEALMIAAILSNLGSISRTISRYETSLRYYEECLAMFRRMREQRWTAASLNGLGLTLLEISDLAAAKRCLQEGLEISMSIQSVPDALDSLTALGELLAKEGKREKAVEIVTFVANHTVTKTMTRQRSEQVLIQLKEQIPIEVWLAAHERGKTQMLEAIVAETGLS